MKSLTVVVILILLALGFAMAGEAWADASPPPEPVAPVTKATARWVYHWHDLAVRARASANHWRSCHTLVNLRAGLRLWRASGWSPWTTM